jgi:3-hydroxybutyryl-CoA dehydratase
MNNKMNKAANISYSDIKEGDVFLFERKISKQDVMDFAKLSGDFNPLHVDEDFGKKSPFNRNIVHGMLAGSLFSTLIGMYCPGEKSLYMSQTLNFRLPLYYGETITVKGTIINKNDSIKMVTLKTEILKDDKIVIDGEAKVRLLG